MALNLYGEKKRRLCYLNPFNIYSFLYIKLNLHYPIVRFVAHSLKFLKRNFRNHSVDAIDGQVEVRFLSLSKKILAFLYSWCYYCYSELNQLWPTPDTVKCISMQLKTSWCRIGFPTFLTWLQAPTRHRLHDRRLYLY